MTHKITPEEFKAIRIRLRMSQSQMACFLRLDSVRPISLYESGEREISGPISVALDYLMEHGYMDEEKIEKNRLYVKKLLDNINV